MTIFFNSIFIAPECAKGHIHYGAVCCKSCQAFFRRANKNSKNRRFVCNNGFNVVQRTTITENMRNGSDSTRSGERDLQCGIDFTTRRHCQYCRYKRCIEIGNHFT